jgi:hypothetical protein
MVQEAVTVTNQAGEAVLSLVHLFVGKRRGRATDGD